MKARVKATGEIVEVRYSHHSMDCPSQHYYRTPNGSTYKEESLDFNDTSDYWEKLKHQYAGMAMQGMLNNSYLAGEFRKDPNNGIEDMSKIITKAAAVYAHALVEKMKEADR